MMSKFPEELVSIVFMLCGLVLLNHEVKTPDINFNSVFVTVVMMSLHYNVTVPRTVSSSVVLRMRPCKNTHTEAYSRS